MGDVARFLQGVHGLVIALTGNAQEEAVDQGELGDAAHHSACTQPAFACMADQALVCGQRQRRIRRSRNGHRERPGVSGDLKIAHRIGGIAGMRKAQCHRTLR